MAPYADRLLKKLEGVAEDEAVDVKQYGIFVFSFLFLVLNHVTWPESESGQGWRSGSPLGAA